MSHVLLTLNNITKNYGPRMVLKGINFELYQGEIMSLLGANGQGKTTLSSIIATLHPPTGGEVLYKGTSIYKDLPGFRSALGYCPQAPNLNPLLTLHANLTFAGHYYGMDKKNIEDRIQELSALFGLEKYLHSKSDELSGGYKQRFLFARSMIHRPRLIILDEPTVGLDAHIRQALWECIRKMKSEGVTILLTTHYLEEAEQLSDRVALLKDGVINLVDTPGNLMRDLGKKNLEDVFLHLMIDE